MIITERDRIDSLLELFPDIFDHKTVLYVGARGNRFDLSSEFRKAEYKITVLEIFPKNVEYLETLDWITKVIEGDVRDFKVNRKFDIVFWWHGPEHIAEDELETTLEYLEKKAKVAVVLGCPYGTRKQGNLGGNPNEKHISSWDGNKFEDLGYEISCLGEINRSKGRHITAVKKVK